MKKLSTRTLLVSLIAIASIASYIYLGSLETTTVVLPKTTLEAASENGQGADAKLPDLRLLMKVIEVGQKWLPAS